jgi:hypothetical protein
LVEGWSFHQQEVLTWVWEDLQELLGVHQGALDVADLVVQLVPGVEEIDQADQAGSPDREVGTIQEEQEEHHMEGSLDQEGHNQEVRNAVDRKEDNRSLGREVAEGSREVDQVGRLEDPEDPEDRRDRGDLLEEEVAVGALEGQGGTCSKYIALAL